jgi:GGDEF domain-containing protein
MGQERRIVTFEQAAARCLPGLLYCFNIADLKRRNSHLGHLVGDKDIEELDRLLKELASDTAIVERIDGQRWLMVSQRNENNRVQAILDRYKRTDRFSAGWQVEATRGGTEKVGRQTVPSEISRAVRCLYAEVKSPAELTAAITTIKDNDYNLPVNRPLLLSTLPKLARKSWHCVAAYPVQEPACPFCQERDFVWEGGDGSYYSGDGTCRTCGAEISIRDISDLATEETRIK